MDTVRARLGAACAAALVAAVLAAQGFRERVDVELVRVELLARDARGRFFTDLRPSEIRITVDGKPVAIESFEAPVLLPEIPSAPPRREPPPPAVSAAAAPAPAPPAPHSYSMAILVDETSSEQSNRQAALRELFDFLQKDLPPGVEVLLMRFDGALRVECPWTSDVERLRRTAAAISRHRVAAVLGTPGRMSDSPDKGVSRIDFDAIEAVGRSRNSLAGLFDALRQFPDKPGRKALFFVTDGAPFMTPYEIARDLLQSSTSSVGPEDGPDAQRRAELEADRDSDLLHDSLAWDRKHSGSLLTDVARLALLRGVEIHPVRSAAHDFDNRVRADRGFNSRATVGGGRPLSARSIRSPDTPPLTDIAAGQGMEATAATTGGEAILSRRMFQDGLAREVSGRDAAYALTFRDPFPGDHRFHAIAIALERKGADLRYRRGYRILDGRESLIEAAANRLHVPADRNPLGVRLQLDSLGEEKGLALAQITVAYPAPPEAGGSVTAAGNVSVIGLCAVRDGALSQPIDLSGKAERTSLTDATWLARSGQVRVKRGAYRWSFAIRDEQTGITSYLTFDRRLP
jgi:VWFA-related protein